MDLEKKGPGCHQFLQGFLPKGFTLHIFGTGENGRKIFTASYEGRNKK